MSVTITPLNSTTSSAHASAYTSGAFTPAAGDRLVAFVFAGKTLLQAPTLTNSAGVVMARTDTFTNVGVGGASLYEFDAESNADAVSQTVTFNCPGDAAVGCIIVVFGVGNFGSTFNVIQRHADPIDAGTIPVVDMLNAFNATSGGIGVFANYSNPAGVSPRVGWTESMDAGVAHPSLGLEGMYIPSGETSATIAWGSVASTVGAAMVVEIAG